MNRRKFLKFLGQATVASGIAVVVGLPEMSVKDDPNIPVHFERGPDEVIVQHDGPTVASWDNGKTWSSLGSANTRINQLYISANGTLYTGGQFTSS